MGDLMNFKQINDREEFDLNMLDDRKFTDVQIDFLVCPFDAGKEDLEKNIVSTDVGEPILFTSDLEMAYDLEENRLSITSSVSQIVRDIPCEQWKK